MIKSIRCGVRKRSFLSIASGLAAAQVVATFFVYQSNVSVSRCVDALTTAGWLALPTGPAAQTLNTFRAAVLGGLFYTLSVGAGLTLFTWAVLYLIHRCWRAHAGSIQRLGSYMLICVLILWAILAVFVNLNGIAVYPTIFVLLIPLVTGLTAITNFSDSKENAPSRLWPLPVLTLLILTAMWASQLNEQLFVAIRDHLLFSNPIGSKVNDFYYRNTLYAAQTFKSFQQKTIRTCRVASGFDPHAERRLNNLLAGRDVLPVSSLQDVDLVIERSGQMIVLVSPRNDRVTVPMDDFMKRPDASLSGFSKAADRYMFFRDVVFAGLLIGFPVLLFMAVDGLVGRLACLYFGTDNTVWVRCAVCMVVGILLFLPMLGKATPVQVSPKDLRAALAAADLDRRVAALKLIEHKKIDLGRFPDYRHIMDSPHVVERYYLARALAFSRTPGVFDDLLSLTRDRHPNVVCQAYYALGRYGNRDAIGPIETQMRQSDHWYTQWYGYRAMRRLGWHQTQSR